jgi:hypothetical protein
MERYTMFMDCKIQYCYDINYPQTDLYSECSLDKNPSTFFSFGVNWKVGSESYSKNAKKIE